jgi:hypothetical protein
MKYTNHVLANQTTSWTLLGDKKRHYKNPQSHADAKIPRELKSAYGEVITQRTWLPEDRNQIMRTKDPGKNRKIIRYDNYITMGYPP